MPVIATPVGNDYDHVSYLVACGETGEAAAIDPYDVELTLETARGRGLRITQIVSTHEHWDHAGRNEAVRAETGASVLVPKAAIGVVEKFDRMLAGGDVIELGTSHRLEVIETPGHTMTHISLRGEQDDEPFLLCGDTLFGAGVGNCGYGGHAPTLFATVEMLRTRLAPETRLYPGHDYLGRNLEFTLRHEPGNAAAAALLAPAKAATRFTTWGEEQAINLFLRLDSDEIRMGLRAGGLIDGDADRQAAFLALRALRDKW